MKTPQDFINFFSAIPEVRWIVGQYTDETGNACCAYGHCGLREDCDGNVLKTKDGIALGDLFREHGLLVASVNDGAAASFCQNTPKQRILAALEYIKKRVATE